MSEEDGYSSNLVLKNSKSLKPSLVDIARFQQLPVAHQHG